MRTTATDAEHFVCPGDGGRGAVGYLRTRINARTPVKIVPVVDVLHGAAVRAVGGVRENYRPVVSRVSGSTDPVHVAADMAAAVGADDVYVADLDAITTGASRCDYSRFAGLPFRVWIDAGIGTIADLGRFPTFAAVNPVVGTETLSSDNLIPVALQRFGPSRFLLSLDYRDGILLGPLGFSPRAASAAGVTNYLVLELAAVGRGGGVWSPAVCDPIRAVSPRARIWVGGGTRSRSDVALWANAGADGVLVASAIHDGTL